MRLATSILAASGLAFLAACGSGFAGSSVASTPDTVSLSTSSGMADDFAVVPGGTAPLAIAATAFKGSGAFADVVPDVTYTWSAVFENPVSDPEHGSYTVGSAPNGFKACPALPGFASGIAPAVPILVPTTSTGAVGSGATGSAGGTGASGTYAGFSLLAPGARARQVYIGAVPGIMPPYCLVVTAMSQPGDVPGSAVVIVSASP